ncbi:MAG: amidohydrolase family protein [Kiritimatiellae bacterium]|nr:amidohydrolase family protein [Kiritimatiellia bacterium]MDD3546235.1 amidohydrolase family protein [Kiritimatiellia bacterium]
MLIDVHTHVFPEKIAERALRKLREKAGDTIDPVADGTPAALLADMRASGLDYAVTCPIATKPDQFDVILAEAEAVRDGARGRDAARHIIPFASVHPADEARFSRLQAVAERGMRGVKLHPYYQPCVLDAPEMLEYFRCCRDLNLIVQCHCGFDVGFPFEPVCGPERVARVMQEVPGLRFIAAHLGGWRQWSGAAEHLLGKDVFLDTAVLPQDKEDPAAMAILRRHPPNRLLFATDWPWLTFGDGIEYVKRAGLKREDTLAILGGNAAKLLGVTKPAAW